MQPSPQQVYASSINPFWPIKSRILAGLLGIFFGGIGAHKFYMGKIGMGILYLLFCWTGIPACVGFIEGLIYLCSSDENFQLNHHVRIE
ncbi:TM2 domain-containing protein [Dialister invisus]